MIVPSMNLQEIRKALIVDFEHEIEHKIKNLQLIYKEKWKRSGRKDFIETISFTTKTRNKWHIIIQCKKGNISGNPYLITYDHTGMTAMQFMFGFGTDSLMYFTTHFFKRYRERLKLEIDKPEELVKKFFRNNLVMMPAYYPLEDGSQQLFCALNGGVGLGRYHQEGEIHEFRTFIDNSMLKENQKADVLKIWHDTIDQYKAELERRLNRRKK